MQKCFQLLATAEMFVIFQTDGSHFTRKESRKRILPLPPSMETITKDDRFCLLETSLRILRGFFDDSFCFFRIASLSELVCGCPLLPWLASASCYGNRDFKLAHLPRNKRGVASKGYQRVVFTVFNKVPVLHN